MDQIPLEPLLSSSGPTSFASPSLSGPTSTASLTSTAVSASTSVKLPNFAQMHAEFEKNLQLKKMLKESEKLFKVIQSHDLKIARKIWNRITSFENENELFLECIQSSFNAEHISSESLCSMILFLNKHPEINFSIDEKTLKSICTYNIAQSSNSSLMFDDVLVCKIKDAINRLFPLYAEKNAFYWIMAFDCIYQNSRKTQKHKLTTLNKYMKSLTLRQYIQLFSKCMDEIVYEKNYGESNNFDFQFNPSNPFSFSNANATSMNSTMGEGNENSNGSSNNNSSDAVTDAFQKDLVNTSNKNKYKQRILSLQIFAQRILLHIHHKKLQDKFWNFMDKIYEHKQETMKNKNLTLEKTLIQAGIPWYIRKNKINSEGHIVVYDHVSIDSLSSEIILPPFSTFKDSTENDNVNLYNLYVYFDKSILRVKNKKSIYMPFYNHYSLSTILENKELWSKMNNFSSLEIGNAIVKTFKDKKKEKEKEKEKDSNLNINLKFSETCFVDEFMFYFYEKAKRKPINFCKLFQKVKDQSNDKEDRENQEDRDDEFLFFETLLFLLVKEKSIPVESVKNWTEKTGNVNLHPDFLKKINLENVEQNLMEISEKFYTIHRLLNP
jgi:hypothetical protein